MLLMLAILAYGVFPGPTGWMLVDLPGWDRWGGIALAACFLGLSLASAAWPFVLISLAAVILLSRVVRIEEAMLAGRFGETSRSHARQTGRSLPRGRRGG
jgi:hypothetical protein